MKFFILTAIFASTVLAGTAFATNNGNQGSCPGNSCHDGDTNVNVDVDQDVEVRQTVSQDVEVRNTNTNVATSDADADAKATSIQGQEQGQGQFQAQGNSQKLTIEDAKNPASSAANLYLANCTSGASAQGFGGGGSVGGPDEVCQLLNAALVGQQLGNAEFTAFAIERAEALLKERTNFIIRFFQLFPVIRRVI